MAAWASSLEPANRNLKPGTRNLERPLKKTLGELAQLVGGRLEGNPSREVDGVASLTLAGPSEVSFVAASRYKDAADHSRAACLVVPADWRTANPNRAALICVADPNRAMVAIAAALCPPLPEPAPGIHPQASVARSAVLGKDVHVGACAVIGERVRIGDRTRIRAGAVVADEATIGADCDIHSGVVIRERVVIGRRVIIHAGAVVGSDGFGYLPGKTGPEKIPQLGTVEIGDDAELGACVTVDRARFGVTRIGPKVKIDNLVQIAHNVEIGEATIIVSQVAIAGSTRIGRGCVIAGQAAIDGHLVIGDGARIAAKAGVTKDVPPGNDVSGYPAMLHRTDLKHQAALSKMEDVLARLKALEARASAPRGKSRAKPKGKAKGKA
jgi:UDP-3-O-[3-hydroxymyristoyl] glucosamine N-acyltransferase